MSKNDNIPSVDITIGANMYGRISDLPNTPSHVLAEFVDNAIQSYIDNKELLLGIDPDYKLHVDINLQFSSEYHGHASVIVVRDNAAGISSDKFSDAFKLAHTPENNKGLNEYGMGMKTAALWLGEVWSVESSALGEEESRKLSFDLNQVMTNELKSLPVVTSPRNSHDHYTIIEIKNPTASSPTERSLRKIKTELASIYRKWLRTDEIVLSVNGEILHFKELPILRAPFAKNPQGLPILWKKDIDFHFGKYRAKGFIGILRDIKNTDNGLVLLRRGRVVVGAETDGRYFPKALCGSSGTFRYKRLFGELELEGFNVSFNKNDIQERENLESLMEALRGEIHQKDFDLFAQAEDYRLDVNTKKVNKIVRTYNNKKKVNGNNIVEVKSPGSNEQANVSNVVTTPIVNNAIITNQYEDEFKVENKTYKLTVQFVDKGKDLVWLDTSREKDNIVICNINQNHVFFEHFQMRNDIIVVLKSMAVAKFIAKTDGNDTTSEFFESFNEYIKEVKI